ncbi:hypothetical protein KZ810_03680 [Sphingomonas sp. RHCKR47]|uniref:hypothetical protein n=1 Tax=Sphingomonas citricola TaxID=2862498 RepID=UPI001CA4F770|nr:hypothetical protein [Sphingomonas citricola]MBW6522588.1 hypothetical protein [Sphingomonas citricola]
MPVQLRRLARALAFIAVTVTLAKAAQYAAVDRLGSSVGFAAASFAGAAPVVAAAAVVRA